MSPTSADIVCAHPNTGLGDDGGGRSDAAGSILHTVEIASIRSVDVNPGHGLRILKIVATRQYWPLSVGRDGKHAWRTLNSPESFASGS
ncbi:MAG: hypothetical protein SFV23_02085 [Planctomycetaceae bacterium]|nr:hypothetical protein [Planctomycetaceae bacterium]